MIVYLNDECPISPTFMRLHCREDAKNWGERYVNMMFVYNKLSQTTVYEVVGDDDLYLVQNLDPKENNIFTKQIKESR